MASRLSSYVNPEKVNFSRDTNLAPEQVWSIFEDRKGCLWAGLRRTLRKICPGESQFMTFPHSASGIDFSPFFIYQIQEDKAGLLWLSTEKGLLVFDQEKGKFITHYSPVPG